MKITIIFSCVPMYSNEHPNQTRLNISTKIYYTSYCIHCDLLCINAKPYSYAVISLSHLHCMSLSLFYPLDCGICLYRMCVCMWSIEKDRKWTKPLTHTHTHVQMLSAHNEHLARIHFHVEYEIMANDTQYSLTRNS